MINQVKIGNYLVGSGSPCLIIAEAGVNHNGNIDMAHSMIDSAVASGANAIKFQSFITEDLVTPDALKAEYQVVNTEGANEQFTMLKALELTADQQSELKAHCDKAGILYLCTPYEEKSIDLLDSLGVAAFKVASTDTTNVLMLKHIAKKNRPILLSTGMCSIGEVEMAVEVFRETGLNDKVIILQCTSEYPVPINEVNLKTMKTLEKAFAYPVGFSDHTEGIGASPWAVALGACVIEKHFTLDRTLRGPDHQASVEPQELKLLVDTIRNVEVALGDGTKRLMPGEVETKYKMQKSIVVKRDIKAGDVFHQKDLTCKRPGTGLPPAWFKKVVGRVARVDLKENTLLDFDSFL